MKPFATHAALGVLKTSGGRLDAPHRLTLLAAAALYDQAAAHAGQRPAVAPVEDRADHAARMRNLIPGAIITDIAIPDSSATPAAAAFSFAPLDLARIVGVTDATMRRYCRDLEALGHLEGTGDRQFTLHDDLRPHGPV